MAESFGSKDRLHARRRLWISATIGLASGFLAGLLGIGGGVVKVPAYVLVLGMSQFLAAGTSTASNLPSAATAAIAFGSNGSIVWGAVLTVFIGSAVGAWYGAQRLHIVPEHLLAGAFSIVMMVAAVRMWF